LDKYVVSLSNLCAIDFQECGGKAANLGELIRLKVNVPPGYCVKSNAYYHFVEKNKIGEKINNIAERIDFTIPKDIEEKTSQIRSVIMNAIIPEDLKEELVENYNNLKEKVGREPLVAIRSSVAVKESNIASFPGLMDTYHYISGFEQVLSKIIQCFASLWTSRATFIRHQKKIDHSNALIAPIVQQMVDSEVAGVMFTINPMNSSVKEILITACWGLGEIVVSGESDVDMYVLAKDDFSVISKNIVHKSKMIIFDKAKGLGTKLVPIAHEKGKTSTLSDGQLKELGEIGLTIERHCGTPQDIEWAYMKDNLYILQTRRTRI